MVAIQPGRSQYEQVADLLRERIENGTYPPGSALPSEPTLSSELGLSRVTINRAVTILRAEGYVKVKRGSGAFVRTLPRIVRDARRRYAARSNGTGAGQVEVTSLGLTSRTEYQEIAKVPASPEVAHALNVNGGSDVLVRRRVLYANDEPTQMADSYYPWEIVQGSALLREDSGQGGSYDRLAELGYPVARYTEDVNVRLPTVAERLTLQLDATAVFDILHIAWTADDRPVEAAFHVMPGHLWTLRYDWSDDGSDVA